MVIFLKIPYYLNFNLDLIRICDDLLKNVDDS